VPKTVIIKHYRYRETAVLKRLLILISACVFQFGCTKLGPDFVKPEAPVANQWLETEEASIKADAADFSDWWTAFDDPVLNDLIEKAYQQNLPLQIAGIRILEARAQLGIAVGNSYPQQQSVGGDVGHVEVSESQPNFSSAIDRSYRDANLGFDMAWELDIWGRFQRGIEAADADLLASIADYDDVLVSLTANVASAYALLRTFEKRLAIARDNVSIQGRSLRITEVRFDNGATTELDVQQARTLLLNTRATIPSLEIGYRQSMNALSTLLGMPPGDLRNMLGNNPVIPAAPAQVAVGIPAELLRRRPDIRRAELLAAAQSARIGIAESSLYPHFALVGSIGLRAGDTFNAGLDDMFELDSIEAFGGPSFSWDIFNYGRNKNNVRVQDARLQQLIIIYQNTVLEAQREVENALVGFVRAQQQVGFLEDSVKAAQRSVDLALIQYRDGVTDYQRMLDTQQALLAQQDLLSATQGDIATNLIAMYRALGGGWQIRQNKKFLPASVEQQMKQRSDWGELLDGGTIETENSDKGSRSPDW
jgi:NodT family efflux transporter outer membrane factor (OMF) lipoprotein